VPGNPAAEIPGIPRSLAELRFAADLRAGEHCAARDPADWRMLLSGSWWRVSANCRRCRAQRLYLVRSDGRDLLGPAFHTGYLQLGGPSRPRS